ncbi:MAG: fimbrillin family protein [Bacteroidales bacterium]|nr:fimbrillin family protein [Bacteroidales bacterium]
MAAVGDNDTLYMYNGADYLNLSVYPKAGAGAEIGEGLFILPQSAEGMTVNFNLLNPDGSLYLVTRDLPKPANGVFEAGKSYEFKIIVKSIEEIVIQAIVKSWEPGFVADGDNTVDILG